MTPTQTAPRLKLNNDFEMPALGLGVYQSSPEDTVDAVESALARGYRLIDRVCAIPKSVRPERLAENIHDFDVELFPFAVES